MTTSTRSRRVCAVIGASPQSLTGSNGLSARQRREIKMLRELTFDELKFVVGGEAEGNGSQDNGGQDNGSQNNSEEDSGGGGGDGFSDNVFGALGSFFSGIASAIAMSAAATPPGFAAAAFAGLAAGMGAANAARQNAGAYGPPTEGLYGTGPSAYGNGS